MGVSWGLAVPLQICKLILPDPLDTQRVRITIFPRFRIDQRGDMEKTYLTSEEVARQLGVNSRTVRNLIHKGRFPGAYKVDPYARNSPYRIPPEDLQAYLNHRHQPQS